MPRRVYTYLASTGWGTLNMTASLGALVMALAVAIFIVDAVRVLFAERTAPANPWNASTLEWAVSSPPPSSNFPFPPTVAGRDPIWDNAPDQPVVVGLRHGVRDVLVTYVLDAEPDHRVEFPGPSIWPLLTALATTVLFVWSIFTPWGVVYGALPLFIAMVGWFWPKSPDEGGTQPWPIRSRTLPGSQDAAAAGGGR
jgi:cytochrome c oxidase subunit 1